MSKRRLIPIAVFIISALIAGICIWGKTSRPQTPHDFLNISRRAVYDGDYPKALDAILNFYDLSFRQDSYRYSGVRSSFAIEIWKDLNNHYPPALDKMKEIRNSKENYLRSGDVLNIPFDPVAIADQNPQKAKEVTNGIIGEALFWDVKSLNKTLHEENRTVELFEFLQKNHPKLADACWRAARDPVMQAERYDLAMKQIPDLNAEYLRLKRWYSNARTEHQRIVGRLVVNSTKEVIKMAYVINQPETAINIAADADKLLPNGKFEEFLSQLRTTE